MSHQRTRSPAVSIERYLLTGVVTAVPLIVTWLIFNLLFNLLAGFGTPIVYGISEAIQPFAPGIAGALAQLWLRRTIGALLVILLLILLGWATTKVVGRWVIAKFDAFMGRIPLAQQVYGGAKKLLSSLQEQPDGVQRVVLIDFPSPEMKSVGFVTATLVDQDTGRELAAVYVPTTPNPTSGYLEIVPLEKLTSTTWTFDEAMTFIVTGGAASPTRMNYDRSADLPEDTSS